MDGLPEVKQEETKKCPKCKLVKNKSEFHKNKNRYDGVVVYCKECTKEYQKEFAKNNHEKKLKWSRDYYKNNKQQHRQTCKAWMNKNKEKMREYEKQWVKDNREKALAKGLKYYYAHHSKCIKAAMDYKKLHPEKSRQYVHKRNAIKQQTATEEIILQDVFERDNWVCQLCGEKVDKDINWPEPGFASLDHIIPLSKGGTHTKDNVQLAHLVCNMRKGNKNQPLKNNSSLFKKINNAY